MDNILCIPRHYFSFFFIFSTVPGSPPDSTRALNLSESGSHQRIMPSSLAMTRISPPLMVMFEPLPIKASVVPCVCSASNTTSPVKTETWKKTTENPHYEGFFLYGDGKGHCWQGPESTSERLKQMAAHVMRQMPEGTTTPWWTY